MFILDFHTCFELQVNVRRANPGHHRNQNRLDQWRVLPDVRQQFVKAVNIQSFDNHGGDVDSLPTGHVVSQSQVVGAAVVSLHLWGREKSKQSSYTLVILVLYFIKVS